MPDDGKRQIEGRPGCGLPVEQEGLRACRFHIGREVEGAECQRAVDQGTVAGKVDHQRARGFVAVERDLCVLDGQGLPRPIDLTLHGGGVQAFGIGHRQAEPACSPAQAGSGDLGLAGELQAVGDIEMALEACLQQVSLEGELQRPMWRVGLVGAGRKRGIECEPLAADREAAAAGHWALAPSSQLRVDVADRLPAAVGGRHVERAAAHGKRVEPHGDELIDQQRGNRADACRGKGGLEARRAGAQPRRAQIEYGTVEDEAGDGRAGRGIAVGIEGAAVERQVRRLAQPNGRRDDVHVARRGHHGIAGERLVSRALDGQHRRKHGEQQAGKGRKNERGKARNDVLASHALDFARLVLTSLFLVALAPPPRGQAVVFLLGRGLRTGPAFTNRGR